MNGLCPACRRPYDDKTIQWKVVTPEEVAEFKANIQKNQKKRAQEQRQKEVQQRQAERNDRKNLVGVRVIQKNLVYVTGLQPTVREDELMKTLRKPEFFGQYGNIQKISISNRKGADGHNQSLGIYVTFEKKEDAAKCIQAVNGSVNGDRVLRAQLGTTKYCSAWLRHEQCTNRQCMFLHEQGDEEDSYTRQDLSSMNSIDSQRRGNNATANARSTPRQQAQVLQPPPPAPNPMVRSSSKDGSDSGDGSALPSSANWARNPQRSRRGSHATSGAASSPAISTALPATAESALEMAEAGPSTEPSPDPSIPSAAANDRKTAPSLSESPKPDQDAILTRLLKAMASLKLRKDITCDFNKYPPLFDPNGGAKRRAMRDEEKAALEPEESETQELSEGEPESGSLALGGEPEDRDPVREFGGVRTGTQPPIQRGNSDGIFGPALSNFHSASTNVGPVGNRTTTPQQPFTQFGHPPPGLSTQSPLFQSGGHSRGASRFSFANDNASAATSVKIMPNRGNMAQQSSMMSSFANQAGGQYYGSSMPGPPPGLKSTGTPPSLFGQGPAFHTSGYGGVSKENELLRRQGAGGNMAHEGKLDLADPSILQARMHPTGQSNAGVGQGLFGGQSQGGYNPMMYNGGGGASGGGYGRW